MLNLETQRGDLRVIKDMVPSNDASVLIGVTGDLKGSILFSFSTDMTLEMVKIMSEWK